MAKDLQFGLDHISGGSVSLLSLPTAIMIVASTLE